MRTVEKVIKTTYTIINTEDFLHFLQDNNALNPWISENAKSCFFHSCSNPITHRLKTLKTCVGIKDFIKGAFIWSSNETIFWARIDENWRAFCEKNNVVDFE